MFNSNIEIVPKNYQQLLRLNVPTSNNIGDIYEEDLFIVFEAFPPPRIQYLSTLLKGSPSPYIFDRGGSLGGYGFLHPNQEISERIQHTYNNDSSTYASAVNNIMDKGASLVNAWKQLMNDSTEGAVYDAPVIWASTERREFNIVLNLFAYNDVEADIYGPIRFFRKHSYPTKLGSGTGLTKTSTGKRLGTIEYPSVFKITGGAFDTLNANENINFFNLTNMSVSFSDSIKFMRRGTPMQAKLSLTFQECLKMYSNWLEPSVMTISVSEKINNFVAPIGSGSFDDVTGEWVKNKDPRLEQVKSTNNVVSNFIKATGIARLANNLKERITNEAIGFALRTIQGSSLYKRFDDAVNLDLQHRLELRNYTHAGYTRSNTIEQAHMDEINNSGGGSNNKSKRDVTIIEQPHTNDIMQALGKVR